jgi:hypothetical protein
MVAMHGPWNAQSLAGTDLESQAAGPTLAAERYLQALEALAA